MSNNTRTVAWQGWKIQIPRRWDPVKLEGDHSEGHALFADTARPRLGLRWQTIKQKSDPTLAVHKAMRTEVGQLAAAEAKPFPNLGESWQSPTLYLEPQPPGRDVFSAYSEISGRLLQIVYLAHRRENLFAGTLLSTLVDLPLERAASWSIFDLNCVIPGGMTLKSQRLNAGDLSLTFADRYHELTIRQIAVAQLALQRQSLDGWIADQQKTSRRFHHADGIISDLTINIAQRDISARLARMPLRWRYAMLWNLPRCCTTLAFHDSDRDRLVILHGTDDSLLQVVAPTVGSL